MKAKETEVQTVCRVLTTAYRNILVADNDYGWDATGADIADAIKWTHKALTDYYEDGTEAKATAEAAFQRLQTFVDVLRSQ